MAITFYLPSALREFADGNSKVEIHDSVVTVGDALCALWKRYPGIRDRIATEQGQVRQHINLFIGETNIRYTGGIMSSLPDGAEITILPAVSGG